MNTEPGVIVVNAQPVEVVRKKIKHLYLSVYPPDGRVRVSAPVYVGDEAVRLAVLSRWDWIRRQQARFQAQPRQSEREMVHGESHYFMGRRYRLMIAEENAPPQVRVQGNNKLVLQVRPGTDAAKRRAILNAWYRAELKTRIPPLIAAWEPVIGVRVAAWGVKRMRTRWGSCNISARRVWLNLELAKKPPQCLEYVLVHEMVHLLERRHNDHFRALMSGFMPNWQHYRDLLNAAPLACEHWAY